MEHKYVGLPAWVTGELGGFTDDSLTDGLLKDRTGSTPIAARHRYCSTVLCLSLYIALTLKIPKIYVFKQGNNFLYEGVKWVSVIQKGYYTVLR